MKYTPQNLLFSMLMLLPILALAHVESGGYGNGGFFTGIMHPITGLDHVIAMVAVGLWGAQLGMPAIWMLPIAFPLIMAFGGALGAIGLPLPHVEVGIAASGLLLGLAVLFNIRAPLWAALIPISIFAIFHGHAHGTEMPDYGVPLLYAMGFVLATGTLHLCGIGIGALWSWPKAQWLVRASGGVIAAMGGYFLVTSLMHL